MAGENSPDVSVATPLIPQASGRRNYSSVKAALPTTVDVDPSGNMLLHIGATTIVHADGSKEGMLRNAVYGAKVNGIVKDVCSPDVTVDNVGLTQPAEAAMNAGKLDGALDRFCSGNGYKRGAQVLKP